MTELNIDGYLDKFEDELRSKYGEYDKFRCTTCGESADIISTDTDVVCASCAAILIPNLDTESEKYYGDTRHKDPTRVGFPTNALLYDSSFGSIILGGGRSSAELRRIRRYHNYNLMCYKERARFAVFDRITTVCAQYDIPQAVIDLAKRMYVDISIASNRRSENKEALIANCLYLAMKEFKIPLLLHEVAKMFGIENNTMAEARKHAQEVLCISPESTTYTDFIQRFVAGLGGLIPSADRAVVIEQCNQICACVDELGITAASTAQSLASAALYFICKQRDYDCSLAIISKTCMVSVVTIQKSYRILNQYSQYLKF